MLSQHVIKGVDIKFLIYPETKQIHAKLEINLMATCCKLTAMQTRENETCKLACMWFFGRPSRCITLIMRHKTFKFG